MRILEKNLINVFPASDSFSGINLSDCEEFFHKVCFSKSGFLPIGYASSPSISNAVMFDFDEEIVYRLKKKFVFEKNKSSFYLTRYSDDFIFSSDEKKDCSIFYNVFKETVNESEYNFLKINYGKNKMMKKSNGNTTITGLRILSDSRISLHPNYKSQVRLLLKLFKRGDLNEAGGVDRLKGHIAYVKHNDPAFYNLLMAKYVDVIERIK